MTSSADWSAAADPARRVGHAVEFHASIGSTNDRARELLRAGVQGVAVVADLQTAGRGRHGRTWTSPPGVSLMVSLGLRADLPAEDAWQLAFAAGLALLTACASVVPVDAALALKWPNDLVDGNGLKVAGLLAETTIVGGRVGEAVIGAGVNVNWPRDEMPAEIGGRATSLCELAGTPVDRTALLGRFLSSLNAEVAGIESGVSPLDRFRVASWLTGRRVEVAAGGQTVAGSVDGIGPDGSLLLGTNGGTIALGFGEVVRVGVPDEVPA
jgi:BirA family transcriptional regulator, biotin operon repressor / biotin---[acetyl-CoA-carboxylase] ligase